MVNTKIPGDEFEFSISANPKSGKGPHFVLMHYISNQNTQQTKKKQELETLRFIKELYYKHQNRKGEFSSKKENARYSGLVFFQVFH